MTKNLAKDEIAEIVAALHHMHHVPKSEAVGGAHVAAACDALQAKCVPPTNDRITSVLGKGSLSTIIKGKRLWEERQTALRAAAAAAPAKSQKTVDLFDELWIEASRSARQEATALKEQLDSMEQKHREDIIVLEHGLEASEQKAETQEAALKDLAEKSAQEREALQKEVEKLTADLKIAEKRIVENAQKESGDLRSLATELISELKKAAKIETKVA